ncbi:hypothetical protein C8R44DRAFT_885256 [Mycena epipterygia]|nr:hypothetical protein C8R44DRAFT_885256 [Mycena epipterygia]
MEIFLFAPSVLSLARPYLAGPFVAPPAGAAPRPEDVSIWLRWAFSPLAAVAVLAVPPLLAFPPFLLQLLLPSLAHRIPNPFPAFFFLSHSAPPPARPEAATTAPGYAGQLYVKGPGDLALLAWTIVLVSLFRLLIWGHATSMIFALHMCLFSPHVVCSRRDYMLSTRTHIPLRASTGLLGLFFSFVSTKLTFVCDANSSFSKQRV